MNCFVSVRYYNLCCIAGVPEKEVLQKRPVKPVENILSFLEKERCVSKAYVLNGCSSDLTQLTLEVLPN